MFKSILHTHILTALLAASSITTLQAKDPEHGKVSATAALKKLQEGNARFVAGKSNSQHTTKNWRDSLTNAQHPFAVIVSCSDSRVPTELIFDQGFGDLFIIRNAGNVIATDVLGTIEYAIAHLNCKLVLIMGHESCGAVTAALMTDSEKSKEPIEVQALLTNISKGFKNTQLPTKQKEKVAAGVEANVQWSMKQLQTLIEQRKVNQTKNVKIAGAVYDLHNGKVNFLHSK